MMGRSSSLRVVWVLTAVINSVMLGQNAEPVNASSPESPALQTAVAAPATKNESLSDKTDQKDSRGWLPPGEDPENHLISPFLKHLVQDQQAFWTAPLDLHKDDWKWLAPFAGFTGAMIASDGWISKQLPDAPSQLKRSKDVSDYTVYSMVGVSGASFLLGQLTHDDHLQEAGLLSGEAAINSTAVATFSRRLRSGRAPTRAMSMDRFSKAAIRFPPSTRPSPGRWPVSGRTNTPARSARFWPMVWPRS